MKDISRLTAEEAMSELQQIANGFVEKSAGQTLKIRKAVAMTRATQTSRGYALLKHIEEPHSRTTQTQQSGGPRGYGSDDRLSNLFSKADPEEALLKRLKELADEKADIIRQIREMRYPEE